MKWVSAAAIAVVLAGCGKVTDPKSAAESACLLRAAEAFPELDGTYATTEGAVTNGSADQLGNFRPLPANGFEWTVSLRELELAGAGELTCAGSLEDQVVKEITLNGVTRRPPRGELWSF